MSGDSIYRVGVLLLDLKKPATVLSRTVFPIFEPETDYEKTDQVPNVVFLCGNVVIGATLYVYYGGDSVTGVATVKMSDLLRVLKLCRF